MRRYSAIDCNTLAAHPSRASCVCLPSTDSRLRRWSSPVVVVVVVVVADKPRVLLCTCRLSQLSALTSVIYAVIEHVQFALL